MQLAAVASRIDWFDWQENWCLSEDWQGGQVGFYTGIGMLLPNWVTLSWHQSNDHRNRPWALKRGPKLKWGYLCHWFRRGVWRLISCNTEQPCYFLKIQICAHPKTEEGPFQCSTYCKQWRLGHLACQHNATVSVIWRKIGLFSIIFFLSETFLFSPVALTGRVCAWCRAPGPSQCQIKREGLTDHPVGSITAEWRIWARDGVAEFVLKRDVQVELQSIPSHNRKTWHIL